MRLRPANPGAGAGAKARSCPWAFLTLPLLLALTGCFRYDDVELCDIANVEVMKFDAQGIAVRVDAMIHNPNNYRINVSDPDVDLFLNDKFIGKGLLDSALVLDSRSTRLYSIPLHADLQGGSLLALLLSGGLSTEMKLGVKGTVRAGSGALSKRFPFELEETIDLGSQR
jgi:LEA14-like dessication related protein